MSLKTCLDHLSRSADTHAGSYENIGVNDDSHL
jgi:hypothetical protein